MPADGELYVFGPAGNGEGDDGEWVSPRPLEEAVMDLVTQDTDLAAEVLEDVDAYVDREALAEHLDGEPAEDSLTFEVEGHEVSVAPDGTVTIAGE